MVLLALLLGFAQVLAPLGADTTGSQFLEPDGTFPNHIPNPENKDAMAAAVNMVKQSGAHEGAGGEGGSTIGRSDQFQPVWRVALSGESVQ